MVRRVEVSFAVLHECERQARRLAGGEYSSVGRPEKVTSQGHAMGARSRGAYSRVQDQDVGLVNGEEITGLE